MGQQLLKYYSYVGQKAGVEGKIRLAQTTHITVSMATTAPDDAVNLKIFQEAVDHIVGQAPSVAENETRNDP
ncbi:MAG: hypothetical protein JXR76_10775 [Deltaproteobacteria bacterium]|nr:hypothetical protein [Deltaproteobacteria bacterium]